MLSRSKIVPIIVGGAALVIVFVVASRLIVERVANPNLASVSTVTLPSVQEVFGTTSSTFVVPQEESQSVYHVPILVFHNILPYKGTETKLQKQYTIEPTVFENQLVYLRDHGYTAIPFDTLVDDIETGTSVPPKSVVLTFDDGWQSQYDNALPLLKKYADTATFAIYTDAIGGKTYMNWDEVLALDHSGMQIASHSKSHPMLTKISDPKKLDAEIAGSKKTIESHLGHSIDVFVYPDYQHNDAIHRLVEAAGYRAARAGWKKVPNTKSELYMLEAEEVSNNLSLFPSYLK